MEFTAAVSITWFCLAHAPVAARTAPRFRLRYRRLFERAGQLLERKRPPRGDRNRIRYERGPSSTPCPSQLQPTASPFHWCTKCTAMAAIYDQARSQLRRLREAIPYHEIN